MSAAAERDWVFHASEAAVLEALASGAHSGSLREYFGTEAYAELAPLARQAGRSPGRRGPRVLILPGMMGSRLEAEPKNRRSKPALLWLDPLQIAAGGLKALALPADRSTQSTRIRALGGVLFTYAKLLLELRIAGCDAQVFGYDWRLGIDELGVLLARRIADDGLPVALIAHSMGGLIARVAMRGLPKRLVRKLIMLGTPNHGAYAPVQALRGTYPFVRRLASLDHRHSADTLAAEVFGTFCGLYHLLPNRRGRERLDLLDPRVWPKEGPLPRASLLTQVKSARATLAAPDSRMVHIVGVNRPTIVSVRRRARGFEYGYNRNGDGTVPAARARVRHMRTYYIDETHANLPANSRVIHCILELLRRGRTGKLPQTWAGKRGITARIDDASLRSGESAKVYWHLLDSAQREAALGSLDDNRLQSNPL